MAASDCRSNWHAVVEFSEAPLATSHSSLATAFQSPARCGEASRGSFTRPRDKDRQPLRANQCVAILIATPLARCSRGLPGPTILHPLHNARPIEESRHDHQANTLNRLSGSSKRYFLCERGGKIACQRHFSLAILFSQFYITRWELAMPSNSTQTSANSLGMCRSTSPSSNSRSFCTYKFTSHLHIPNVLKVSYFQSLGRKSHLTPAVCADPRLPGRGAILVS